MFLENATLRPTRSIVRCFVLLEIGLFSPKLRGADSLDKMASVLTVSNRHFSLGEVEHFLFLFCFRSELA